MVRRPGGCWRRLWCWTGSRGCWRRKLAAWTAKRCGTGFTATARTALRACAMSRNKGRAPAVSAEQMRELEGLVLAGPD